MAIKVIGGVTVDVDAGGYLTKLEQWTKDIATALAKEEGIALTDRHWQVIDFMRKEVQATGVSPTVRRMTLQSGVTTSELYALFPGGPGKKAAKIAGVPKPVGCV